jgi:hypothetical protein
MSNKIGKILRNPKKRITRNDVTTIAIKSPRRRFLHMNEPRQKEEIALKRKSTSIGLRENVPSIKLLNGLWKYTILAHRAKLTNPPSNSAYQYRFVII